MLPAAAAAQDEDEAIQIHLNRSTTSKKKKKSRGVVEVTSNKHDYTERKLDHIVAILNEAIIE